jgi:hypothetical protein
LAAAQGDDSVTVPALNEPAAPPERRKSKPPAERQQNL